MTLTGMSILPIPVDEMPVSSFCADTTISPSSVFSESLILITVSFVSVNDTFCAA